MAKIPCEIIRDLLPLYQDDICSEKSRNAIEEHIKECESCRTYLKKMEGEIPIETDKIEGTDEEWKGFREFSEKVSRKLNGRIVMACGVVFLICTVFFSGIRNVFIPGNLTQPGFDAAFSLKMLYSF